MKKAMTLEWSGVRELERQSAWRRTGTPNNDGPASWHRRQLKANKNLLEKPYRPV
jgi:hypothetical protein